MTPRTRIIIMIVALILLAWALSAPDPRYEASNVIQFKREHAA